MDPYFKKNINFRYKERDLNFRVSQSLFSSQDIDLGTKHLLKSLTGESSQNFGKILDLGCGYGPIGISLKIAYPFSEVHMVDKDALALSYCLQNIEVNHVSEIKVYASLGYDDVTDNNFDLIVSNIPAKVGDKVLTHILKDAKFHLRPGGKMAIVVIDAISAYVTQELNDPEIKIVFRKKWAGYSVFHYEFLPSPSKVSIKTSESFDSGIYDRNQKNVTFYGFNSSIRTTYNLPEFDTLSYETEVLLESLEILKDIHSRHDKKLKNTLIFNPGQGYVPVVLSKLVEIENITLVDRDLQSLRLSKENLISNGYFPKNIVMINQVGISIPNEKSFDCVIGILDESDASSVHSMYLRQATEQLSINGVIIFVSGSTAITRLEALLRKEKLLQIIEKRRSKGRSVLIMKRRINKHV